MKTTNGDHSSAADELVSRMSETEQRCRAVENAVKGKYISLLEALKLYRVSADDYQQYASAHK